MNSFLKYKKSAELAGSPLCVGLDVDLDKIPGHFENAPNSIFEFNKEIIDATKDLTASYKINFAFYEQYGIEGLKALDKTLSYIPSNIFTIADAKRGDIGNSSKKYAKACFEAFEFDSITVAPYMGSDSVKPFLEYTDKFVFLLALTSNQGSFDFQREIVREEPLYMQVIRKSMEWASEENLGFVVGATFPQKIEELRAIAYKSLFLIPGVGAQGGDSRAVIKANMGGPALINVSRDIIFAGEGEDFAAKARERALLYKELFSA